LDVKDEYVKKWEDIVVAFATDGDAIDDYLSIYLSIVDDGIDRIGDASAELTNAFDTRNIDSDSDVVPRLRALRKQRHFSTTRTISSTTIKISQPRNSLSKTSTSPVIENSAETFSFVSITNRWTSGGHLSWRSTITPIPSRNLMRRNSTAY